MDFNIISVSSLPSICRTCLLNTEVCSIYEAKYGPKLIADLLEKFLTVKVTKNDNYPKNMCQNCMERLCASYDFIKMCVRSKRLIKKAVLESENMDSSCENPTDGVNLIEASSIITYIPETIDLTEDEPDVNTDTNAPSSSTYINETSEECKFEAPSDLTYNETTEVLEDSSSVDYKSETCSVTEESPQIDYKIDDFLNTGEIYNLNTEVLTDVIIENNSNQIASTSMIDPNESFDGNTDVEWLETSQTEIVVSTDLSEHDYSIQSNPELVDCHFCNKSFQSDGELTIHLRYHENSLKIKNLNIYKCTTCKMDFDTFTELSDHFKSNEHLDKVSCRICNMRFLNVHQLKRHNSTHKANTKTNNEESQCVPCGIQFSSPIDLMQHYIINHSSDPKCVVCKETQPSERMSSHLREHSEKMYCALCNTSYYSFEEFKAHFNAADHVNPKMCNICNIEFQSSDAAKQHMSIHAKEKPFQCYMCGISFAYNFNLEAHLLNNHKDVNVEFSCDTCGLTCKDQPTLYAHMKEHPIESDTNEYICYVCGWVLKSFCGYKFHMRKHVPSFSGKSCKECGESFRSLRLMIHHMNKQHGTHHCDKCSWKFYYKSSLASHLAVHEVKPKYTCQYCSKKFKVKQYLKIHLTMHTGEKPYVCHVCGKGFRQSIHRTSHMVLHTGERPYKCKFCEATFAHQCNLIVHNRLHTGETPYKCAKCEEKFTNLHAFKRHNAKHDSNALEKKENDDVEEMDDSD